MRVALIDNYDSFSYNLVQGLRVLGADVTVWRNDAISVAELARFAPDRIVLSPGPSRPENAGICIDVVRELGGRIPLLGVCLGHQAIAVAHGARVVRAGRPMHGKASPIRHDGRGALRFCPEPLTVARYHSLVVDRRSLPASLIETATSLDDGEVMGIRYLERGARVEGVQFHPESYLTPEGNEILRGFLWKGFLEGGDRGRPRSTEVPCSPLEPSCRSRPPSVRSPDSPRLPESP